MVTLKNPSGQHLEQYSMPPGYPYWQPPPGAYWHPPLPPYQIPMYAPYYWPAPDPHSVQTAHNRTAGPPVITQQRPKLKSKKSLRRLFEKLKTTDPTPPVPPLKDRTPDTTFHVQHPVEICDVTPRSSSEVLSYYTADSDDRARPDSPLLPSGSEYSEPSPRSSTFRSSDRPYGNVSTSAHPTSRNGSASTSATSYSHSGSTSTSGQSDPRFGNASTLSSNSNSRNGSISTWEHPALRKSSATTFHSGHRKNSSSPPAFDLPYIPPIPKRSGRRKDNEEKKVFNARNSEPRKSREKKPLFENFKSPEDRLVLTKTSRYPTGIEADLYVPDDVYRPRKGNIAQSYKSVSSKGSLKKVKSLKSLKDVMHGVRPQSPPPLPGH